jgi:hypothetical protein
MSSNDADTLGTSKTPEADEGLSGSRTRWQMKLDFLTVAATLWLIQYLVRIFLSKVLHLNLGFMDSRYWHLACDCIYLVFLLSFVMRVLRRNTPRRRRVKRRVKGPTDPTISSKEDLVSALLSDRKLTSLFKSILTDQDVDSSIRPTVARNLRDFASNLAAEGWDHVAGDATKPLITEEGSHDATISLVYNAIDFELSDQRNDTSTVASEQHSSLLINSSAYRIFKADCLRLAHEPYEKRISQSIGSAAYGEKGTQLEPEALRQAALEISWTPLDFLKGSQGNANTLVNQFKAAVEGYFGPTWNWWPLTSRQYTSPAGYARVEWLSPCGTAHHLDLPEDRIDALLYVLRSAPRFMCLNTGSAALMARSRRSIMRKAFFAVFGDINDPSSNSEPGRGQRSSSRHTAGASSLPSSGSKRYQPPASDKNRLGKDIELQDQSSKVRKLPTADVPKDSRYVYLCTHRGDSYFCSTIECDLEHKDRAFFGDLKTRYIASRGFWRYYLSMWVYDHCEFYQVRTMHSMPSRIVRMANLSAQIQKFGINACSPIKVGFPSDSGPDYEFAPAPPSPSPPHGPITEFEFRERFYRSGEKYFGWQARWEAMYFENDNEAYQALPKRTKAIHLEKPGKAMFYGLYAKEKRSFARFLVYFFLCFSIPGLVFFMVYLAKRGKASELPSAGWPLTVALTLVSILMGELVHSREDGKKP